MLIIILLSTIILFTLAFKPRGVPPEFLISRQNVHHNAGDIPFGLWMSYYEEIANWIRSVNFAMARKDPFTAFEYLMILFGMVQPAIQTKKIKWKDEKTGEMKEQYRIIWYREKIEQINKLQQELAPYIIRNNIMMDPPWRFTKNDRMSELPQKANTLMNETRMVIWQINFDMASVGLTFPRGDDPSTSLMKSQ